MAKLEIDQPGSPVEREADRAADAVMAGNGVSRLPEPDTLTTEINRVCEDCEDEVQAKALDQSVQRQSDEEDEDELVQPKSTEQGARPEPGSLDRFIKQGTSGGGRRLPDGLGSFFSSGFGQDFSDVRIHTDGNAAASAKAIKARAYAVGSNVVFGAGQYAPDSNRGRWLMAHELAHVAQGKTGGGAAARPAVERDADRAATDILTGKSATVAERRDADQPALFGEPQHVPQFTYIAGQNPRGDGFLRAAIDYHNAWRLRPRVIDSMEDIVNHLAGGRGDIRRIRIVTHASKINLFMSMFNGGTDGILEPVLRGFSESGGAGLDAELGTGLIGQQTITDVVDRLRQDNPAALQPFGLDQAGSQPAGAVARLIRRSVELLMHTAGAPDPTLDPADVQTATGQAATIATSITTALAELKRQVQQPAPDGAGVTAQQAEDLQAAILGVNGFNFTFAVQQDSLMDDLTASNRAVAGNFYRNLARVRARFKSSSWVDIRGCRVGNTLSYMRAVQEFFGTGADKPHVSAPNWWQTFPIAGYQSIPDSDVPAQAANPNVQAALDHWFVVAGVESNLQNLILFYQDMLIRAQRQEIETERRRFDPPGLAGGLQSPQDLGLSPPLLPGLELPDLQLGGGLGQSRGPTLGGGQTLTNPLIQTAQDEIASVQRELQRIGNFTAEEKLNYYLGMALVLPVRLGGDPEDVEYLMLHRLRRRAMTNWLGSVWAENAPGLRSLQRRGADAENARRVEAVVDQDPLAGVTDMFFAPDTEYAAHIVEI